MICLFLLGPSDRFPISSPAPAMIIPPASTRILGPEKMINAATNDCWLRSWMVLGYSCWTISMPTTSWRGSQRRPISRTGTGADPVRVRQVREKMGLDPSKIAKPKGMAACRAWVITCRQWDLTRPVKVHEKPTETIHSNQNMWKTIRNH